MSTQTPPRSPNAPRIPPSYVRLARAAAEMHALLQEHFGVTTPFPPDLAALTRQSRILPFEPTRPA